MRAASCTALHCTALEIRFKTRMSVLLKLMRKVKRSVLKPPPVVEQRDILRQQIFCSFSSSMFTKQYSAKLCYLLFHNMWIFLLQHYIIISTMVYNPLLITLTVQPFNVEACCFTSRR